MASAIALSVRTCRPGEIAGAFAHLLLGPLVERDEADRARRQPPPDEQVARPLGEHAGLAGTGRGDDAGCAAGVHDGCELVGSEVGARSVGQRGRERPVLDGNGVEHRVGRRPDR